MSNTERDADGPHWFKASASSGSGGCLEVAVLKDGRVGVRDSKVRSGPHLTLAPQAFGALIGGVVSGTV